MLDLGLLVLILAIGWALITGAVILLLLRYAYASR